MLRFNQYPAARWGLPVLLAGSLVVAGCGKHDQSPGPHGTSPTAIAPSCGDEIITLYHGAYQTYLDGPNAAGVTNDAATNSVITKATQAYMAGGPGTNAVITAEVLPGDEDKQPASISATAGGLALQDALTKAGLAPNTAKISVEISNIPPPDDPAPTPHLATMDVEVDGWCLRV